jgi:enoyl-CoA hydratase/carnithine racemase
MTAEQVTRALDRGVLTLTLNRPDKLNAYTAHMGRELAQAFRDADADDAVRAVIVTGAGKGFCAGADISGGAGSFGGDQSALFGERGIGEQAAGRAGDGAGEATHGQPAASGGPRTSGRVGSGFVEAIYACRKPSIAAINGAAVGVGLTMTLPMDIRIAARSARFGFVFARRGLVPEAGSAWFLPRIVGLPQALRWC